jgi:hypothetical protein
MKTISRIIIVLGMFLLIPGFYTFSQVAINTDGTTPDNSAMLDVKSIVKGALLPRMTQAQRNAIASPANSLLIYQTDVAPGYYYNAGTSVSPSWMMVGNCALTLPYEGIVSFEFAGFKVINDYSPGSTTGIWGEAAASAGRGLYGMASSVTGINYGVYGLSNSSSGTGVYGQGNYGMEGISMNTTGRGVYGKAASSSGINYGVYGQSESSQGYGVNGQGDYVGVLGGSTSSTGYGIIGENSSSTGAALGVYGFSNSSSGKGVYGLGNFGIQGTSNGATGRGVYGQVTSSSGINYGVYGESNSSSGRGVYGQATSSSSGVSYGVYGEASSTVGRGVYGKGVSSGVMGESSSSQGIGVCGQALATTGNPKGIYGLTNSATGYSGYFTGGMFYVESDAGIGTLPEYKLDVAGTANLNHGISLGVALRCDGAEALWYNGTYFSWGFGGLYNYFGDEVTIGTSAVPGYTLVVNGSAAKTGGGSWTTLSDARLKNLTGNYNKGLAEIITLQPVRFFYKEGNPLELVSDEEQIGFIAQEVQKVFPEAVNQRKDGYLDFNIHPVNIALVNAIKELNAKIDNLENENNKVKAENEKINSRLIKLEALMSLSAEK